MRLQRIAPALLIVATLGVVAIATGLSDRVLRSTLGDVEHDRFAQMQSIVELGISGAQNRALSRAEMIANLPSIRALVAAGDRDRLRTEVEPTFQVQRDRYGVEQMQFHVPPGVALLRLHAPDKFGDTTVQPLVLEVLRTHVGRSAVDIARAGPAMFGTVPVAGPDGAPAGSFQVGVAFADVLDRLKNGYGFELGVFFEEALLHASATSMAPEVFDEQNRVGRHLKLHATDWALLRQLVSSEALMRADTPQRFTGTVAGVRYGVLLLPVADSTGRVVGVLAAAQDFSATRAAAGRARVWQTLIGLIAFVLLSGAILVVVRGFVLGPLRRVGAAFDALARGDRAARVDEAERLGEELAVLARHHERLRKQAADTPTGTRDQDPAS